MLETTPKPREIPRVVSQPSAPSTPPAAQPPVELDGTHLGAASTAAAGLKAVLKTNSYVIAGVGPVTIVSAQSNGCAGGQAARTWLWVFFADGSASQANQPPNSVESLEFGGDHGAIARGWLQTNRRGTAAGGGNDHMAQNKNGGEPCQPRERAIRRFHEWLASRPSDKSIRKGPRGWNRAVARSPPASGWIFRRCTFGATGSE